MGVVDSVIKFSVKKNLGKWLKGAATVAVANGSEMLAEKAGVVLTPEQKFQLEVAAGAAFLGLVNILKTKFKVFAWLP